MPADGRVNPGPGFELEGGIVVAAETLRDGISIVEVRLRHQVLFPAPFAPVTTTKRRADTHVPGGAMYGHSLAAGSSA